MHEIRVVLVALGAVSGCTRDEPVRHDTDRCREARTQSERQRCGLNLSHDGCNSSEKNPLFASSVTRGWAKDLAGAKPSRPSERYDRSLQLLMRQGCADQCGDDASAVCAALRDPSHDWSRRASQRPDRGEIVARMSRLRPDLNAVALDIACSLCDDVGRPCECDGTPCTLDDIVVGPDDDMSCGHTVHGGHDLAWGRQVREQNAGDLPK